MIPSISESSSSFTRQRVLEILRSDLLIRQPRYYRSFRVTQFDSDYLPTNPENDAIAINDVSVEQAKAERWCMDLVSSIQGPDSHVELFDQAFSSLVICALPQDHVEEAVISRACYLLERLPKTPLELYDSRVDPQYHDLHSDYFLDGATREWQNLRITNYVCRNLIRVALHIVMDVDGQKYFPELLNVTAQLLEVGIDLSSVQSKASLSSNWFICKAFFWTFWQRCLILHQSQLLSLQLSSGVNWVRSISSLSLRGAEMVQRATHWKGQDVLDRSETSSTGYMCNWAFGILKANKVSVGQDFRRFHERFNQVFHDRLPRCVNDKSTGVQMPCDERYPERCTRLVGLEIKNQSAHATFCDKGCSKLYWNQTSWTDIGGKAAVSLDAGRNGHLNYCEASARTMAVSHVWSHGQGGRPELGETGLNSCLHGRYTKIARSFGCDSYWMDTPCIPSDHRLRRQAIANINRIFADSKLTLICDKDLMSIDVNEIDIRVQESLLVTLLVCDWNVRAWTLLEALRGRNNLYILCKDDRVVSLKDTVENVNNHGCADIAVLFLSAQHLLPQSLVETDNLWSQIYFQAKGFVSIEDAATLLSRRHASRPGDEIIIWGLLMGDRVFETPNSLWRREGQETVPGVRTGYLISNIPRLSDAGLSWAPARPNLSLLREDGQEGVDICYPYDGGSSQLGFIHDEGLRSDWWEYKIDTREAKAHVIDVGCHGTQMSSQVTEIRRVIASFVQDERWCSLLQPISERFRNRPEPYAGHQSWQLFAVVVSHDSLSWKWKGLFEWDKSVPLPKLEYSLALLIT